MSDPTESSLAEARRDDVAAGSPLAPAEVIARADQRTLESELIRNVPCIVWEIEVDEAFNTQRFLYLNGNSEDLLGYPPDELADPARWRDIFYQDDIHNYNSQREELCKSGKDHGVWFYRVIRRDGRVIPIEAQVTIFRDEDNVPRRIRGVTVDISDRYRSEQRLRSLVQASEILADSFEFEDNLRRVAHLLVPTHGDLCLIHLREGESLRTVAIATSSERLWSLAEFAAEKYPMRATSQIQRALAEGRSVLMSDVSDADLVRSAESEEHLALLRSMDFRSSVVVPIVAHGEVFGSIVVSAIGNAPAFDESDRVFVEELGRQAGLAVHRARLYEASQREIERRTQVQKRMEFLAQASALLSSTVDAKSALVELATFAVPAIADFCYVTLLDEEGVAQPLVALSEPQEILERMRSIAQRYPVPADADYGLGYVLRTKLPVIELDLTDEEMRKFAQDDEHFELLKEVGLRSSIIHPLIAHDTLYGAVMVGFAGPERSFDRADLPFVEELARRAALAVYKSRLLEDAHREIRRRKELQQRLELLERLSTLVSSSFDARQLVDTALQVLAPAFADWVTVDLVTEQGSFERFASYHSDPARRTVLELFQGGFGTRTTPAHADIFSSGKPLFVPHVDRELLTKFDVAEERKAYLEQLGSRSIICIPLISRSRTLGILTFVRGEATAPFVQEDVDYGTELGSRLASGIDNALLLGETKRQMGELLSIYHTSPIGLALVDRDLRVLRVNAALAEMHGRTIEEHSGARLTELGVYASNLVPYYRRVFETGESIANVELFPALGLSVPDAAVWIGSFYPVRDERGDVAAVSATIVDISDRSLVERQLREAKEGAEVANRAKDQFIAALSHELRTPLTPVLATIDLLEGDDQFPVDYRPFLDLLRRNVQIEARLIDDLLDMTRIAKGKLSMREGYLDAHALLLSVIEICRSELDRHALHLVTLFEAEHTTIRGDEARLQQVFWNLIHNACKFTPENGTLTLRTSDRDAETLAIELSDTGRGIAPEDITRIFDPFEQDNESRFGTQGGLGLGLAISRSIVEMHGGTIRAESDGVGKGARFIVELNASLEEAASTKDTRLPAQSTGGRILLVDDHADTNTALKILLERRGYEVRTAATMAAGLEAIRSSTFDLLVSDIGLPDGSGIELLTEVRKHSDVKAIAVSGYGTDQDLENSRLAGFLVHLKKPLTFPDLERAIAEALKA